MRNATKGILLAWFVYPANQYSHLYPVIAHFYHDGNDLTSVGNEKLVNDLMGVKIMYVVYVAAQSSQISAQLAQLLT